MLTVTARLKSLQVVSIGTVGSMLSWLFGAAQVWRNALKDQAAAVASYRKALALGGTVTLPALYSTAGAVFSFDPEVLKVTADLVMDKIDGLSQIAESQH